MNAQDIYNTVAKHLFAQGERAWLGVEEICAYRGDGGTACAVGCLIPDDIYTENMEGKSMGHLLEHFQDDLPEFFSTNLNLLRALQTVHDERVYWQSEDRMREQLSIIAADFNLSDAVLEGLSFPKKSPEHT